MKRPPRDKDYLRTADGLLFNVTGDVHPPGAVYGSLKYVAGEKWTSGYDAACQYLRRHFPQYVRDYICVPQDAVVEHYCPQQRFQQLRQEHPVGRLGLAVELGELLADFLQILPTQVGVTDSFLWGTGHAESDMDLVVYGQQAAQRLLQDAAKLYRLAGFARPDPTEVCAPYGHRVADWHKLLSRKLHMGTYAEVPFSLRAVRDTDAPILSFVDVETSIEFVDFDIHQVAESLYFPAVYRNASGGLLVDYTVVYEGVLRVGDRIRGTFPGGVTPFGQHVWFTDPRYLKDYQHRWRN